MGKLTLIEYLGKDKYSKPRFNCLCDCGNIKRNVNYYLLKSKTTIQCNQCSQLNSNKLTCNLIGMKFNKLTVVNYVGLDKNNKRLWACKCDCGNPVLLNVTTGNLTTNSVQSCGCLRNEMVYNAKLEDIDINTYDLHGEYGVGYTSKGEEFYFDLEDYDLIKGYCWCIDDKNYVISKRLGDRISMHRIIMNCPDDMVVDHINGFNTRNDNRKYNLRNCTSQQNNINRSIRSDNTSGVTGVCYHTRNNIWYAQLMENGKNYFIGSFQNKSNAIKARLLAEKKYFGEFAPQKHLYKEYGIKDD